MATTVTGWQLPERKSVERGIAGRGGAWVHLPAGIDQGNGTVLVKQYMAEKKNEITYVQPLLAGMQDLGSVVVTTDTLHTQRAHAKYPGGRATHYVLTVKGNPPKLHDQIRFPVLERRSVRGQDARNRQ